MILQRSVTNVTWKWVRCDRVNYSGGNWESTGLGWGFRRFWGYYCVPCRLSNDWIPLWWNPRTWSRESALRLRCLNRPVCRLRSRSWDEVATAIIAMFSF